QRSDTLLPCTTLFRSLGKIGIGAAVEELVPQGADRDYLKLLPDLDDVNLLHVFGKSQVLGNTHGLASVRFEYRCLAVGFGGRMRSEEHTSELQARENL